MDAKARNTAMNGNVSESDKVVLQIDELEAGSLRNPSSIASQRQENGSLERNDSYFFDDDPPPLAPDKDPQKGHPIDPPSRLIGSFLRRQNESGDFQLDPELSFSSSRCHSGALPPPLEGETGIRSRRRTSFRDDPVDEDDSRTPPVPVRRAFSRTKSRLVEQQPIFKSGILKSAQPLSQNPSPPPSAAQDAPGPSEDDPLDIPDDHPRRKRSNGCLVFELVMLSVCIGALICTSTLPSLKHKRLFGLNGWRWAVLALVVLSGRFLSGWIIWLIVFFIERNFILRKRLVYFVYGLQKGVQNCLWFGIILLAWRLLFDPNLPLPIRKEKKFLEVFTKVLVCLLVGASIWLLKILLVKVLALNFHVSTYFDRIQENLFNQYIVEALSGPPLLHSAALPPTNNEGKSQMLKKSGNIGKTGISIDSLQKMNQRNVSAWNMKRLIRLAKSSRISTLADNLDSSGEEEPDGSSKKGGIESEWQAKLAAKHIYHNVVGKRTECRYITLADLMRFLGDEESAIKAFALFDGAVESGKITKQSLVNFVVNVYNERRALAFSLNDTKTAVNKLHRIIDVIVGIVILIISLLILGIATTHLLVALSSQVVLAVFVFGNSCKTAFEAIIFLFAMHPFDVGDRCVVDGVQMVVEEMNILTTVFLRYDNEKIYYPNSVLATKPISNFYRSPDMGDAIDFSIHISTPREKLEALKEKVEKYIQSHLHHWHPKHDLVVKEIEDMNRIQMALWLRHTMNHQNAGEKWIRRSELILHLRDMFQELDIDYRLLPQEVRLRHI